MSSATMSSAISQLSCFSSINRRLKHHTRSIPCLSLRPKVLVVKSRSRHGRGAEISSSETKTALSYSSDTSKSQNEMPTESYATTEEYASGKVISEPVQEHVITQQKRAAKIHDFCFGIPFGGIVLSGGLVGFIISRNPATLGTGLLFGGALLALSTVSLKVWRQGMSSLPLILGQAALSAVLLWKNFQTYSLTKKIFPTGFYAFISAAMLCFYLYVVLSGGNPPPKKLKTSSAAVLS
ncbi:protein FATTY ACID EXPORT 1, chloroplastic-like [Cornus florida]|uniref:protein FATTY ACID EXPORT 1, chloroplastic-like n=1 Tax=Cornus florida TaxID=4283 RepID=UPI00289F87A3|nr:protein FATTY ACID EXPORT 1, chloroplastic-like [Cornus florida]